jgi:hypothetical protein
MTTVTRRIGRAALFAYVGLGAFMGGIMANAMPALSPFGVGVFAATAPLVMAINSLGGNIAGTDFVPQRFEASLFEFGKDATSLTACNATGAA